MRKHEDTKIYFNRIWSLLILFLITFCYQVHAQQLNLSLNSSSFNGYNISCFGNSDGSVDLTITGGVPPYQMLWSTGDTIEDLENLPAGYYNIRVTDSDSIPQATEAEITLTEPRQVKIISSIYSYPNGYHISLDGACNGIVNLTAEEGVTPYTWLWNDSSTSSNRTSLCAGWYSVMVLDANGCQAGKEGYLKEPPRDDWQLTGNEGTDNNLHFIGTSDSSDLIMKTNDQERFRVSATGTIKFGALSGNGFGSIIADSLGQLLRAPCFSWATCGNILSSGNYLGSSNSVDLVLKANSNELLRLKTSGKVSIKEFENELPGLLLNDYGGEVSYRSFEMGYPSKFLNAEGDFVDLPAGSTSWIKSGTVLYNLTENIGIGTTSTNYKLHIKHDPSTGSNGIKLESVANNNANSEIKFMHNGVEKWAIGNSVAHSTDRNFFIYDNEENATRFYIDPDGRVGIGTIPPTQWAPNGTPYKLYVNDGIVTRDIKVTTGSWPDYVFSENYPLLSIAEFGAFIKVKKRLPGIPSAVEIGNQDGFEVGFMVVRLLEKLEEQALYIVDLHKQLSEMKNDIEQVKNQMK